MESILQTEREWKPIEGYEGLYEISRSGEVRRLRKWNGHDGYVSCTEIMKSFDNGNGYLLVSLTKNHQRKNYYIHRLVAQAFIENPSEYKYVNHVDYNTQNNDVSNLEWCTASQNLLHSSIHKHGFRKRKTNTGERFITYRKSKGVYRVIVQLKEYGSFRTLKEAIQKRDRVLEELENEEKIHNFR